MSQDTTTLEISASEINPPATYTPETWTLGINDPSFIAWLIFSVYFIVAILCWRARANQQSAKQLSGPKGSSSGWVAFFWLALASVMVLLGLNKQLDLHPLLIDFIKDVVAGRHYSSAVRIGTAAVAALAVLLSTGLAFQFIHTSTKNLRWAYAIQIGLLGLQVSRFLPGPISEIMVMHVFTEEEGILHIHYIEILELACLLMIGWFAIRAAKNISLSEGDH